MTDTGKELSRWADKAMWTAEPSDESKGTTATLVSCNPDPLGELAALNKMFVGVAVHDLSTITDDERREVLGQIKSTVLKMPLETVRLHFLIEGVHRGITHQMVRQRTGAYAQESMRFAVKEDMKTAVAHPPSLLGTLSLDEAAGEIFAEFMEQGWGGHDEKFFRDLARERAKGKQAQRFKWDDAVEAVGQAYLDLINDGMPAEDARGLVPTNVLTKLHYITNLRSFYDTMAMRVSDQAQYEWRHVIAAMVKAMREFGAKQTYDRPITAEEDRAWREDHILPPVLVGDEHKTVRVSSEWQFVELTQAILPVDFALGRRGFASDLDRASRTAERVDAFAAKGIPSSRWLEGSLLHQIPPLHPDEWLLDPNSARLKDGMEFDIWGNTVPAGTGDHWYDGQIRAYDGVVRYFEDWK